MRAGGGMRPDGKYLGILRVRVEGDCILNMECGNGM